MYTLDRIRVAGYRSIRDQTVELRPLNLLIGANGSGKSNFIGVFGLLHEIVNGRLQLYVARSGGASQILHFGRKVTEVIELDLAWGARSYQCDLIPAVDDSFVFAAETFQTPKNLSKTEPARTGKAESGLAFLISSKIPGAREIRNALMGWRIYHFNDTSASARVKQAADVHDNHFLRSDAGNLAAVLYRLQETQSEVFRNLTEVIQMVAPFFGSFQLQPDRLNTKKIRLEWQERGSDAYFNADALSDGTLRFICLASLLLQPELPSTILLDEPELGLHPYAITVLADLLRSAATRTQVIVSTQSVTLVNQFGPEDILVVDREDGASVFRRLTSDQIESWLDDYALGELWEKNVLGGRPGA
ncbi:MAG TPA: AAA family ATPase [Thermoanaerobaculia bacterium]|nr:AAA family ATPase [Thermoanaerobaculia bacterium]